MPVVRFACALSADRRMKFRHRRVPGTAFSMGTRLLHGARAAARWLGQLSQACLALGLFPSDYAVLLLFLGSFLGFLWNKQTVCLLLCPKCKKTLCIKNQPGGKNPFKIHPKCCYPETAFFNPSRDVLICSCFLLVTQC